MLPRRHRLTDSPRFTLAVRRGRRIAAGSVVGHFVVASPEASSGTEVTAPQVGLIVSKRVGNSVQRHRVSRILRHATADHIQLLPADGVLVLRALPGAAGRDSLLRQDVATIVARAGRP